MAVAPTFVADMPTLQKRLRLSGIPSEGDAMAIFEEAVRNGRVAFQRRLGHDRIVEIKAMTRSDDPATADEYMRATAEEAEVKIIRRELMATLPTLFQDSSGTGQEEWDDEAPFRKTSSFDRERSRAQLQREIEELFELLEGSDSAGEESSIRATTIEPDTAPTRLGQSIWE